MKKRLVVKAEWCKGCGICAAFCPAKVLEIADEKVRIVRADSCVFCGQCELRCPDFAIYTVEDKE